MNLVFDRSLKIFEQCSHLLNGCSLILRFPAITVDTSLWFWLVFCVLLGRRSPSWSWPEPTSGRIARAVVFGQDPATEPPRVAPSLGHASRLRSVRPAGSALVLLYHLQSTALGLSGELGSCDPMQACYWSSLIPLGCPFCLLMISSSLFQSRWSLRWSGERLFTRLLSFLSFLCFR